MGWRAQSFSCCVGVVLCCRWGCDNNVAANDKVRKEGVKSSRLNF